MRDHYQTARVQMLHCSRKLRDLRGKFPIFQAGDSKKHGETLASIGKHRQERDGVGGGFKHPVLAMFFVLSGFCRCFMCFGTARQ